MKIWQRNLLLALSFFFIFYIYLVFISYHYNFDGVVFSQFLRSALFTNNLTPILAPHHLLYFPFGFVTYKILSVLTGYSMLEYYHLQLLSLFMGLATLAVIYRIFKSLKLSFFYRLSGLFMIAFSFLFWYFSIETEVHMPGFFFMTLGIYYLFFKPGNWLYWAMAALMFAFSAGFHLTNGLITVSILLFFIYTRTPFKRIVIFYSLYGFFMAIPYLLLVLTTRINLLTWAKDTLLGKSVFTGYSYSGTHFSRWRTFSIHSLGDSLGSVKNGIIKSDGSLTGLLASLLLIFFALVIIWRLMKKKDKGETYYFLFWLIPFFLFFTYWQPANYEFKLNVTIPLIMAFIFSVSHLPGQKWFKLLIPVICILLFALNFSLNIIPGHRVDNNPNYALAQSIAENTGEGATVVIAGTGKESYLHGKIYIPYFAFKDTIVLDWRMGKGVSFAGITREIADKVSANKPVYFLSETLSITVTMRDILGFHNRDEKDYLHFLGGFEFSREIPLVGNYYLQKVERVK